MTARSTAAARAALSRAAAGRDARGRATRCAARCAVLAVTGLGALGVSAAPVWANSSGSSIASPAAGTTVTSASTTLGLQAQVVRSGEGGVLQPAGSAVTFSIKDPQGTAETLGTDNHTASGTYTIPSSGTVSWSPTCAYQLSACGAGTSRPAYNGAWTLSVTGDGASKTSTFTVDVPPPAPANVAAAAAGPTSATVTWTQDTTTPQFLSYDVSDDRGTLATGLAPGDVCSGGSCSYSVTYPTASAAGSHTFTVTANRSGAAAGSVLSTTSSPASVTLTGPPQPTPSTSPSAGSGSGGGGSTGGSTGSGTSGSGSTGSGTTGSAGGSGRSSGTSGSAAGGTRTSTAGGSAAGRTTTASGGGRAITVGTAASSPAAITLGFTSAGAATGVAALPPLPNLGSLPGDLLPGTSEPTQEGTYSPQLAYPTSTVTQTVPGSTRRVGAAGGSTSVVAGLDTTQLVKSLAVALIVLALGLHLRAYVRRESPL